MHYRQVHVSTYLSSFFIEITVRSNPEMTPVYLLKLTGSFMSISGKGIPFFRTVLVLLVHPGRGIRSELTVFRHFGGIRNTANQRGRATIESSNSIIFELESISVTVVVSVFFTFSFCAFCCCSRPRDRVKGCCVSPVIFCLHFRQPNLSHPATDLAEIWQADRKFV